MPWMRDSMALNILSDIDKCYLSFLIDISFYLLVGQVGKTQTLQSTLPDSACHIEKENTVTFTCKPQAS